MNHTSDWLMGIPINSDPKEHVLGVIQDRIEAADFGNSISITNTESMYHALRRPGHMAFIRNAEFSLCDGVGVIAAGFFWGLKVKRYNGPILQLDAVSDYGQSSGVASFLSTVARRALPDLMAAKLKAIRASSGRYPAVSSGPPAG